MSKSSWMPQWMTFSLQSPGDEQCNNGETPHRGRDITNLSPFFFSQRLATGAHWRIFSRSVGQNCSALLSFQLFKKSHEEEDEGEKIQGFFSHIAPLTRALEIPGLSSKITFFPHFFSAFNHLSSAELPGVAVDQKQTGCWVLNSAKHVKPRI